MSKSLLKKAGAVSLAMAMAAGMIPFSAMAASSEDSTNAASVTQDLRDKDIIDTSRKGSLHLFKYDTTAAEAAGDYHEGDIKATGQQDTGVSESELKNYAIKGVEFTYLKVGEIETVSNTTTAGSDIEVVYEIPDALQAILNDEANGHSYLKAEDAFDMSSTGANKDTLAHTCDKEGVKHYTSTQIDDALQQILTSDNIKAKNALEAYLVNYGSQDKTGSLDENEAQKFQSNPANGSGVLVTDAKGEASVENLPLGLYLIVETKVPEMVTETVNPWFITLPFTNVSKQEEKDDHDNESAVDTSHTDNGVDSTDNNGGDYWLYDFYAYPKNQTGNPTIDKSVRNAYSIEQVENNKGRKNDHVDSAKTYTSALAGKTDAGADLVDEAAANSTKPIIVYNAADGTHADDTDDAKYVANRGGYTTSPFTAAGDAKYSHDFEYRDATTASEGDVLDYIVVTKLPTITSKATYLSEYTFVDELGKGITYNMNDVRIAFYANKDDAVVNNTAKADLIWQYDQTSGNFTGSHAQGSPVYATGHTQNNNGGSSMTITMTEAGLNAINAEDSSAEGSAIPSSAEGAVAKGLSGYYMVLYYTATVESNDQVTLGDEGNQNDVALIWARTAYYDENRTDSPDNYFNEINDRNYVYSYGIDLTKTFSKAADAKKENFDKVQFKLYNETDGYYVIAEKAADGTYYVTGKTANDTDNKADANNQGKGEATAFTPNAEGRLFIKGLEADKYQLTEVKTADGYTLLKDPVAIEIVSTDRDVKAAVAGAVGLTADEVADIVANYNDGIKNEDGQAVNNASTDVGSKAVPGPKAEEANGRTIGETDMYVGDIQAATSTVDGKACTMLKSSTGNTESDHAEVKMSVLNQKNWTLPQTGGKGLYLITILGILAIAAGVATNRKKKENVA